MMSLRRRQILLVTVTVALAVAVASGVAYVLTARTLRQDVDAELASAARVLSLVPPSLAELGDGRLPDAFLDRLPEPSGRDRDAAARLLAAFGGGRGLGGGGRPFGLGGPLGSTTAIVADADGTVLGRFGDAPVPFTAAAAALATSEDQRAAVTVTVDDTPYRVVALQMGEVIVQAARDVSDVEASLARLAVVLVAVTVGGALTAAGAGVAVSRAALRPVTDLTAAVAQLSHREDLAGRLPVRGRDEIARLAGSFNGLLDTLAEVLDRQRRLVADASHELRTPIAAVRTNVEVLQRAERLDPADRTALVNESVAQLDELTGLVANLVDLARGEELGGDPEPLDLGALVSDVGARVARGHPHVTVRVTGDGSAHGVRQRLERAVWNLLDNAAKFSPPGTTVQVHLDDGVVVIDDEGPGIPEADRERVFDTFWRATTAQHVPGSGLGLSIVAQVAASHGGTVSVADSPAGGTRMILRLPRTG